MKSVAIFNVKRITGVRAAEWLEIRQRVTSSVPTVASIQPLGSDWSTVSQVWSTLKVEAGTPTKCSCGNDTVSSEGLSFWVPSSPPCSADKGIETGSTDTHLSEGWTLVV